MILDYKMENIYENPDLNKRIDDLDGLSVRKVANIIHNSLMLIENPEPVNYNTTSRLYRLLTEKFTFAQRQNLDSLLNNTYASEDEELKKRLDGLTRYKWRATYSIDTEEDLAADVMANLMYNVAKANARFYVTRKTGDAHLEQLADKYYSMKPELEMKGINFEQALAKHFNHMVVETHVYKKYANDFMNKYTEKQKKDIKYFVKGDGEHLETPVRGSIDRLMEAPKKTAVADLGGELLYTDDPNQAMADNPVLNTNP